MNLTMAITIEERLVTELYRFMEDNPMPDLRHRKMFYIKHIADKIDDYEENFLKEKKTLGMSDKQIHDTMEYVRLKMLIKHGELESKN